MICEASERFSVSFLLTKPIVQVAVLLSNAFAGVVAAPLLVLFGKDLVATLALSVPTNASIPAPP